MPTLARETNGVIGPSLPPIDEAAQTYLETTKTPGMALAVTTGNEIVWARGYGYADLEAGLAFSKHTIQYSGSIAKTFTATVALQLWEKGLIDLEADISRYLPYQVRNPFFPATPITIRQILTHTSSICETFSNNPLSPYALAYRTGDPGDRPGEFAQIWLAVDGVGYGKTSGFFLEREPGTTFHYANASWLLIADVVETVTGISFRQWCKDYIFLPLELNASGFYLADIDVTRHAALYGYVDNGQPLSPWGIEPRLQLDRAARVQNGYVRYALYQHPNFPDGGLRTTAYDLTRWLRCWLNEGSLEGKRILQEKTVALALSSQLSGYPVNNERLTQGFAWYQLGNTQAFPSPGSWWHAGSDFGVLNQVWLSTTRKVGAVMLSNCDTQLARDKNKSFFINSTEQILEALAARNIAL
jgi:CubicO group peptidase (beta-lactamase class C family)